MRQDTDYSHLARPAGNADDFIFKMSPFLFNNGWTDRNADSCVNTVNEKLPTAKNLLNFGQWTLPWQPILCRETATS